jgi:hydrogenase nickel incorporation protein HypB
MHQVLDLGINLLHANQHRADHNREHFDAWGVTCLNLMSAPGAGKTSLLEKTVVALAGSIREQILLAQHRRQPQ